MLILEDSIEIKTTPEKIWDFFVHSEETYNVWHPDHVTFRWVKGNPLQEGSIGYFEEYLHGELHKSHVVYTKIVPNKEIEFSITHPIWRLFYPKSTFTIEQEGDTCIFIARSFLRPRWLYTKLAKGPLEATKAHVREEGENLKQLLEQKE
jgi:hypothetical protein